jgi:hypothetical protein
VQPDQGAFVTARSCGGTSSGKGSAGRCGFVTESPPTGGKGKRRKACDRFLPPGPSPDCARKPADAAIVAELMTDLVRSRIVPHRTPRARLRTHSSWAELAALLDSCSQPSAELLVQFSETIRSLHSAFFKGNSVPLQHSGPPTVCIVTLCSSQLRAQQSRGT